MSDLEKAARLALEALEVATTPLAKDRQEVLRAQAALRQALEQPAQKQEPVAIFDEQLGRPKMLSSAPMLRHGQELYTSPQPNKPWVGLTDVEWVNIVNKNHAWWQRPEDVAHEIANLVEVKLKEKNT